LAITRFILVRHGETTWNREGRYQGQIDTPLSPEGMRQSELAAAALKDVPLDACYSSPLSRAFDLAKMCADIHGLAAQKDARLIEINHGEWEGLLADEVKARYPDLLRRWKTTVTDMRMPGGETIFEVRDRAMAAFREYAARHAGETVLLVAHDAVNKAVLCEMLGADLGHFWQIKQDNAAINVFEWDDAGGWRIVLLNSTTHLGYLFSGIEQKGL